MLYFASGTTSSSTTSTSTPPTTTAPVTTRTTTPPTTPPKVCLGSLVPLDLAGEGLYSNGTFLAAGEHQDEIYEEFQELETIAPFDPEMNAYQKYYNLIIYSPIHGKPIEEIAQVTIEVKNVKSVDLVINGEKYSEVSLSS